MSPTRHPPNLSDALPTDKYTALAANAIIRTYPIDLGKVGPTVMDNEPGGKTAAEVLGASGKTADVPPLVLATISFWRAAAHRTCLQGTYESWTYTCTQETDTASNDLKGSVSGIFDEGTWSSSDDFSTSSTTKVTTEQGKGQTFTVPDGQNWQEVVWQWTTAVGYLAARSASGESIAQHMSSQKPFHFEDLGFRQGEGHHRKLMGYQIGLSDWAYFGDSTQIYVRSTQYNAETGALIS